MIYVTQMLAAELFLMPPGRGEPVGEYFGGLTPQNFYVRNDDDYYSMK